MIGTAKIRGKEKNISASLKSTVDKVYISGNRLPNIYIESEYTAENLTDGIVKIKEVH